MVGFYNSGIVNPVFVPWMQSNSIFNFIVLSGGKEP